MTLFHGSVILLYISTLNGCMIVFEPSRGKADNAVSEQVRHKPACKDFLDLTEDSYKLEILDLESRGIVLSV